MRERRPHVVVAGVSARALAESAARAGYRVTAVDAFGDLDLRAVAEVLPLPPGSRWSAAAAARIAAGVDADAVAYLSNFENHPAAIRRLARGRTLLGNPAEVAERVRRPLLLASTLARAGFAVPRTRATAPAAGRWLVKPRRSGGGHGTRVWRRGTVVPRTCYVQEWIDGTPGSIVFAADGARAFPLAVTRQLVGDARFGGHGFRYCGSLVAAPPLEVFDRGAEIRAAAAELAAAATRGKAVVYARRAITMGDTTRWLADPDVRDVPSPGERIARARPICTVLARGATVRACLARLERRAAAIYRAAERGARRAA